MSDFLTKDKKIRSQDGRSELIRGEPLRMQAPTTVHQSLLLDLATELNQWFKGKPCQPVLGPDWVLEIPSLSTSWRDQTDKRRLYDRHGVREYRVLNPDTFDLLTQSLQSGRFGSPYGASLKDPVAIGLFPGLVVGGQADPEEP